jgi:hypothetical protein
MAFKIRRADYYYCIIRDEPGEGYQLLTELAELGVNLLAFGGLPLGPDRTQFTMFPEEGKKFVHAAHAAGLPLDGPHHALLVQGDDELGALARIHETLAQAGVNVYASHGVTDGQGSYGYVIHVRPQEYDRAAAALEI